MSGSRHRKMFQYVNGSLHWCGVDVVTMAEMVGTPSLIYSEARIRENVEFINQIALGVGRNAAIALALKAAGHAGIVGYAKNAAEILQSNAALCEVMSYEEYVVALRLGFGPERIVVNGLGWQDELIQAIVEHPQCRVNVDNLSDCRKLSEAAVSHGTTVPIGVRLIPGNSAMFAKADEKMGISPNRAVSDIEEMASMPGVKIVGVSFHALHRCADPALLYNAASDIVDRIMILGLSNQLDYIDVGGGLDFGTKIARSGYQSTDFAEALKESLSPLDTSIGIIFEPGRYVFGDAAIALATVKSKKESESKRWLIVDVGTNLLVPIDTASFAIHAVKESSSKHICFDVADGICSPTSVISENAELPSSITEGDLVVVENSGAYVYALAENWGYAVPPLYGIKVDGTLVTLRSAAECHTGYMRHWGLETRGANR